MDLPLENFEIRREVSIECNFFHFGGDLTSIPKVANSHFKTRSILYSRITHFEK
jgi:hypothetical protein